MTFYIKIIYIVYFLRRYRKLYGFEQHHVTLYFCVLKAWGEDQNPGKKSKWPNRREFHGTEHGSPAAGQSLVLPMQLLEYINRDAPKWKLLAGTGDHNLGNQGRIPKR